MFRLDADLYVVMHAPGIGHVASHASDLVYHSAFLAQPQPIQSTRVPPNSYLLRWPHLAGTRQLWTRQCRSSGWPAPGPPWMTQRQPNKRASAVIRTNHPMSPRSPKRGRWSQAAPEIELTSPPESPTTAMTQAVQPAAEATTQVVPQAGEPKTPILDELLGAAAPTSAQVVALASRAGVAESFSNSQRAFQTVVLKTINVHHNCCNRCAPSYYIDDAAPQARDDIGQARTTASPSSAPAAASPSAAATAECPITLCVGVATPEMFCEDGGPPDRAVVRDGEPRSQWHA